jgi:small conductance mechanosensitive channel
MNNSIEHGLDALTAFAMTYGLSVLGAIVTLAVGVAASRWLGRAAKRAAQRSERIDDMVATLLGKVVRVAVLVFTLIAVLNRFGVETTSLVAMLGATGLAIGLALQGTLSNVAAGVMLLLLRPFKQGDAVKVGGEVIVIDALGLFACRGHLPDGPTVFLPNSNIWGQTLVNLSVTDRDLRRIDEVYGIAYDDDIDAALGILRRIAAEEPRVLDDPAPLIKVESLGDSAVNILFRVWTVRADWWDTKLDLIARCKRALEAGGCSIPFPQRDVRVIPTPTGSAAPAAS